MKRLLAALITLGLLTGAARGASTINPTQPSANSPLSSGPVRDNFLAAYNDINNILGVYAGSSAPANPIDLQSWADKSTLPVVTFRYYNKMNNVWVPYATLNVNTNAYATFATPGAFVATPPLTVSVVSGIATYGLAMDSNFAVVSNQLALASAVNGRMLATCTGSTGEFLPCTWGAFASQVIGSTNGVFPHYVGGTWSSDTTGVAGHSVPFLDGANNWSAVQNLYPGGSAQQAPLTSALWRIANLDSTSATYEADGYGASGSFSCVRASGTNAIRLTLSANDEICRMTSHGYDGSAFSSVSSSFRMFASQTWTGSAHGSYARVATTPNGSITESNVIGFENDGGVTVPPTVTGGSKGAGTINLNSLYVAGQLLNFSHLAGQATLAQLPTIGANTILGSSGGGTPTAIGVGTGVFTALGINVGLFGSFVTMNGVLGTPSSATLTNATGLPISGISGLGTGVSTALGSSVTGSGGIALATSASLTTPSIAGGALSGTFSGTPTLSGANFVTLANLVQSTAGAQFLGVSGASAANYAPFTLSSLSNLPSPHATLDLIPIVDHNTGTIKNVTPGALGAAGAVSSINGQTGALVLWNPPEGRLTLTSATPVMATSVAAATTVYFTGYNGGKNVPVYNGSAVAVYQLCAANTIGACELSVTLGSNWSANTNYDFFLALDTGPTLRLVTGPSWNAGAVAGSDVVRGTGAGSTELTPIDGLLTNKNSMTGRYNNTTTFTVAANQGTYVGTCRMSAAGQTQFIFGASSAGGTAASFNCWNLYNRRAIRTTINDSNTNWNYSSATIRSADNSANNRASFISGLAEDGFSCQYTNRIQVAASGFFTIGCSLDSTSAFDRKNLALNGGSSTTHFPISVKNDYDPRLGWHFVQAVESGDGTNNNPSAGGPDESFIFEFEM